MMIMVSWARESRSATRAAMYVSGDSVRQISIAKQCEDAVTIMQCIM